MAWRRRWTWLPMVVAVAVVAGYGAGPRLHPSSAGSALERLAVRSAASVAHGVGQVGHDGQQVVLAAMSRHPASVDGAFLGTVALAMLLLLLGVASGRRGAPAGAVAAAVRARAPPSLLGSARS